MNRCPSARRGGAVMDGAQPQFRFQGTEHRLEVREQGVGDEPRVELDGADALRFLAHRVADRFGCSYRIAEPDGPHELDVGACVVDRQISGRNPCAVDIAGFSGNDPETHRIDERRRRGDHAEAAVRCVSRVAVERVVVTRAVALVPIGVITITYN